MIFADIKYGFAFSDDAGETWTVRKFNADGKVVGWPNNFLRLQDNGSTYQIQQSSDNGATWTMTTDGFPNLGGVIQSANGIGMINGRVYVYNTMEATGIGEYPGYYFYIDNGSISWSPAVNLGQIPYVAISIDGASESDLYVSTANHGVWTNAATVGIEHAKGTDQFILAYPNPADNQLFVECELTVGTLSIIDISGRVVAQSPFLNKMQEVNTSNLKSGMYIMNIHGIDKHFQTKFIKL